LEKHRLGCLRHSRTSDNYRNLRQQMLNGKADTDNHNSLRMPNSPQNTIDTMKHNGNRARGEKPMRDVVLFSTSDIHSTRLTRFVLRRLMASPRRETSKRSCQRVQRTWVIRCGGGHQAAFVNLCENATKDVRRIALQRGPWRAIKFRRSFREDLKAESR